MTEIDAYFYQHQIIVKRGKEYKIGEVLLAYLSHDFGDLTAMLNQCKHYSVNLHYPETRSEIRTVNQLFRQAHNFFSVLYQLIASLPPYNSMPPLKDAFDEMREKYEWLINMSSDGKSNDCVPLDEIDEAEDMDRVLQFDAELKALIEEHQTFLEDLLRVQKVFAPFLERVHHRSEFLSNEETAAVLDAFMRDTDKLIHSYDKLKPSGTMTMTYQVLHDNDHPVLCEQYHFTTIGAFLYVELFKGLQNHYLPKRCGYCGRYFLLESAYYSDYCTREVEDMNGKRCRDLGHRKKYADKIKNDPVWLTYSRAYKAHYARFLKKKMTQAEFQVWADHALDLRQQALDGTIEFKTYMEEIRK